LIFWIVHSSRPPWKHHVNLIQIFKKTEFGGFLVFWFFQKKIWDPGSQDPGDEKKKKKNREAKKEEKRLVRKGRVEKRDQMKMRYQKFLEIYHHGKKRGFP
jgi:hypothetical protein